MRGAVIFLFAALSAAAAANASPVSSLEVAPTTLELNSGEPGLLYVANRSTTPVTVQIDVYDWKQSANADKLELSGSAYVSPPLTTIAPGERQIVRILAVPTDARSETPYRVRVSELPDPSVKANGVQVLVQFSIPVFVRGSGDNADVAWSANRSGTHLEITARNNGARTLKLAGLTLSAPGDAPLNIAPEGVTYILPGASHAWSIEAPSWLSGSAHIAAMDERKGKALVADVMIAR